jgi:regulator of protease activity HflC (stomatin/prohibitin superfamily)
METLIAIGISFLSFLIGAPLLVRLARLFGLYTVVQEGTYQVFTLFGKVVLTLSDPGLCILPARIGATAFIIRILGKRYVIDMRLNQDYLRSQPVNSEEGAPMGIGIWYEMYISDPLAYLFKNVDPRGSLRANVSNTTVRCLSNMKLGDMLETRHTMSKTVRDEVSPKSHEWGYKLGTVYVRKVHFRDGGMIRQIEEKVVNRLRQVTSAIRQDGANQVGLITSTAERQAAIEFAKAAALWPRIVGEALQNIARDPEVLAVMFELLEVQRILDSGAALTLLPPGGALWAPLLAAQSESEKAQVPPERR